MKTVKPQEIVDAYKSSGCRPLRGRFIEVDHNGGTCLCALSVLSKERGMDLISAFESHIDIVKAFARKLGISGSFAHGLVLGWDGHDPDGLKGESKKGYEVGQEAFLHVSREIGNILDKTKPRQENP